MLGFIATKFPNECKRKRSIEVQNSFEEKCIQTVFILPNEAN